MAKPAATLDDLIDRARAHPPIRVAVIAAAQGLVLETVREARSLGLIEPHLVGDPDAILACAGAARMEVDTSQIVAAKSEAEAARAGVDLVRQGDADAVMKGNIHTDAFMRALLDKDLGLRAPGRRVSHVFMVDIPTYPKLLAITDAAINIAPDLNAKAQILENAIEVLQMLGVETPKVAVLSAVETVNPAIAS
ncbi:MAG: phosphate acetyl/butaryl transferase, partial [Alphaproteobacteria bacterium]